MSKIDMVFGQCIHGNNLASCPECKGQGLEDNSDLEDLEIKICLDFIGELNTNHKCKSCGKQEWEHPVH